VSRTLQTSTRHTHEPELIEHLFDKLTKVAEAVACVTEMSNGEDGLR